jgi:hypothetical protein
MPPGPRIKRRTHLCRKSSEFVQTFYRAWVFALAAVRRYPAPSDGVAAWLSRRERQLRRPVCAAGQPARPQVSRGIRLPGSDHQYPALTDRSGTQRARADSREHQSPPTLHVCTLLLVTIVDY